jgi:beta-xylosidase
MAESTGNSATTPIVSGFYPDPTICRVADDYYLAHSSFEYFPGVPIWHSRDLTHWMQIGHVVTRRSQFVRGDCPPSSGLYAGTLRHHDGHFWYVTTLNVLSHRDT